MIESSLVIDKYLKDDPSIEAPITSDSINGNKRKEKNNADNSEDDEPNLKRRKSVRINNEKEYFEDFQNLIKKQTNTIVETIKEHIYTCEIQQCQHDEQIEIFKEFLKKF